MSQLLSRSAVSAGFAAGQGQASPPLAERCEASRQGFACLLLVIGKAQLLEDRQAVSQAVGCTLVFAHVIVCITKLEQA